LITDLHRCRVNPFAQWHLEFDGTREFEEHDEHLWEGGPEWPEGKGRSAY
jgi:hypothetical protein